MLILKGVFAVSDVSYKYAPFFMLLKTPSIRFDYKHEEKG